VVALLGDPVANALAVEQVAEGYSDQPEVVDQLIEDLQPKLAQAADGLSTED